MNKEQSGFNATSKKEWGLKIISDLKGMPFDNTLCKNTEGIKISPIYHSDDNYTTNSCQFPDKWERYQFIDATNAQQANKKALKALKNNISGLCFSNPNNLNELLDKISIQKIRIDFTNYTKKFPKEWKRYSKDTTVQGAFHSIEEIKITNFLKTVSAGGGTAKEQILSAYNQANNNSVFRSFRRVTETES